MSRRSRLLALLFIAALVSMGEGCGPGGVGMGVSSGGARWGGSTGTGPGVIAGGPAY
jgi:hypothetical protein